MEISHTLHTFLLFFTYSSIKGTETRPHSLSIAASDFNF